jgi:hypothetical protein
MVEGRHTWLICSICPDGLFPSSSDFYPYSSQPCFTLPPMSVRLKELFRSPTISIQFGYAPKLDKNSSRILVILSLSQRFNSDPLQRFPCQIPSPLWSRLTAASDFPLHVAWNQDWNKYLQVDRLCYPQVFSRSGINSFLRM